MSVINTNYLALVSQNNLTKSQGALGTAIERLSSGLRINSAKDDAAGQAIANRFTANIKGLTQASRNANDGISIAQTTEGALNEINNNLQRIRELTVQAANDSNSPSDLESIQAEIQQRLDEIDRVSEQTQFNGVRVLGETATTLNIQVGAHDNETISVGLRQINAEQLGLDTFTVSSDQVVTGKQLENDFGATKASTYSDGTNTYSVDGDGKVTNAANEQMYVKANGDLANTASTTLTAVAGSVYGAGAAAVTALTDDGWTQTQAFDPGNDDGTFTKNIGGTTITATIAQDGTTTVTFDSAFYANSAGEFQTSDTETYTEATVADLEDGGFELTGSTYTVASGDYAGTYTANDKGVITGSDTGNAIYLQEKDGVKSLVAEADATSATTDPLALIDEALADVDALRGELGAVQNRFQSTIANLSNTITNLSAARSRIEDADYAVEVSNMTRAQILQQAGTSVLAQANQVPQTVLSLLR